MNPAIRVENLSKRYRIGKKIQVSDGQQSLIQKAANPFRNFLNTVRRPDDAEILWALKNVSFEVQKGEVLGIIGRNGAGKSTLLKILSRITEPTKGRAMLIGRVGSLLEVGTGFHPELTGRENIYMNGAILGMRKAEIDSKFNEIVDFAEIERFIDTPVKRYSSGMYVRLAFAVAAHLEPEILLVDEVLAVGDAAFQKKCLGKMDEVSQAGRTVLFISHNMSTIEALCSRTILLQNGTLVANGETEAVIKDFIYNLSKDNFYEWTRKEQNIQHAFIRRITLLDEKNEPTKVITTRSQLVVEIEMFNPYRNENLRMGLNFFDMYGKDIFATGPSDSKQSLPIERGMHIYRVSLPKAIFMPQRYSLSVSLYAHNKGIDRSEFVSWDVEMVASLATSGDYLRPGILQIRCEWDHRYKAA